MGRADELAALDAAYPRRARAPSRSCASRACRARARPSSCAASSPASSARRPRWCSAAAACRRSPSRTGPSTAWSTRSADLVREPSAIEALAEPDRQALLRVFPVLSRALPATAVPPRPDEVDSRALRQVGFEALRAVLASVARAAPLVVWIDDAQWADADSAALAKELFARDDAPPLLLVVSYQSERRDDSALLKALDALPGRRELRVGQLPPREAEALAARALGADTDEARRLAELVARESGGSPFFVLQLAQDLQESGGATAPRLGDVVRRRIDALDPDAQRLLTLAAVAGAAVERRTLLRAASMGEWGRREVTRLVGAGLLRLSPVDGQPAVETRHDRVREAILAAGGEAVRRDAHRRLADALLDQKSDDLDALVLHLVGAGDDDRAARYALPAAERAAEALAFDHAASLYRVALRAPHKSVRRDEVLTRLAEALTSAGRGGEAAQAFMEAAAALAQTRPADPMVMDLRRRAAERFVCSGRYVEGMRVMREVLDAAGVSLPSTPRGAALAGVAGRASAATARRDVDGGRELLDGAACLRRRARRAAPRRDP
ncbi:MAG: AAA family ATPase [Polyangiales bacterium]